MQRPYAQGGGHGDVYVKGVSTRKVQSAFGELCDVDITADQVSRAMRELDAELENWRNRPIGAVKVLFADATYHKVRVDGVVVSAATFIVAGVLEDGHRAILAVDSDVSENEVHGRRARSSLVERSMHGVRLIVSDSHDGLIAAREVTLPSVTWQRCQMHLQQNAQTFVMKAAVRLEVASDIRSVFNARSLDEAKRILAEIVGTPGPSPGSRLGWKTTSPRGLRYSRSRRRQDSSCGRTTSTGRSSCARGSSRRSRTSAR